MDPTTAALLVALASYDASATAARRAIYLNTCTEIGHLTPKLRVDPKTLKNGAAADYARISLAIQVVYNSTSGTDSELELAQSTFCKSIAILNADR